MKPTTLGPLAAAVMACMVWPGCTDSGKGVESQPSQGFWQRLGSGLRDGVAKILPSSGSAPAGSRSPAAEAAPIVAASRGTLFACRRGQTVLVDLNVYNVPSQARMIATGLKLSDGTAVAPKTVLFLGVASDYPSRVPRVDFDFAEGKAFGSPAAAAPLCLRIAYQLDGREPSMAGASFALVLGEPDDQDEREFGITSGVPIRHGGPAAAGVIHLGSSKRASGGPVVDPAMMRHDEAAPSYATVRFRFDEALATKPAKPADTMVWIVPAIVSMTEPTPRRAAVAAAPVR